ncbi:hypothetical protein AC1031_021537 [Aphanomyces cochlioides]|nr:hypothetical protein AC1031_021537 [Aphanomyces cochlioides]
MTIWNDYLDAIWLNELLYQVNVLGQRSDTGFKKSAFSAALSKLNHTPGLNKPFTMAQLRSRNEVKKVEFSIVHKMASAFGMGWEDSTCRVVCTDTTWEAYFAENTNPKVKKWQNKSFPLYHKCCELYGKNLATGNMALSSNQPNTSCPSAAAIFSDDDDIDGNISPDSSNEDINGQNGYNSDNTSARLKRRPPPLPVEIHTKRNKSLASRMTNVFEKYEATAEQELKLLANLVQPQPVSSILSSSERALILLQSEFADQITTDDLAIAFEVMENPMNASLFLHMEGEARYVWLMRQIRVLKDT